MEPFGVFQFLQSLLNSPAPPQENPTLSTDKNTKECPSTESKTNIAESKNNDAYIQFISAHESRVKRTRK
jgi:hypothetical protein